MIVEKPGDEEEDENESDGKGAYLRAQFAWGRWELSYNIEIGVDHEEEKDREKPQRKE